MLLQEKTVTTKEPEKEHRQEDPECEQYFAVPYGTEENEESDEDCVAEEETVAGILEKASPDKF